MSEWTMDKDKEFELLKVWSDLEKRRKNLDFEVADWCRQVRAQYDKGERGDEAFCDWCMNKIGTTVYGARELLLKARASTVLPDAQAWKELGGYRAIRPLVELPKRDQVSVIQAAKSQARAPINIMRERGLIADPVPRNHPPAPVAPPPVVVVRREPKEEQSAYLDAVALAQYIARTNKSIPRDILVIVNRYRTFMRKAV